MTVAPKTKTAGGESKRRARSSAERRLRAEVASLRARVLDADETVRAIRAGEVDALVLHGHTGEQIFTLKGAETSYRVLVETMSEGAATFGEDGTILYCNACFAALVDRPLELVMGACIDDFIAPPQRETFRALVRRGIERGSKSEVTFCRSRTPPVPAHVSLSPLVGPDGSKLICLVATDLSAHLRSEEMIGADRLATSVLEQATDAILVCGLDRRIIRASKGVAAFAKQSPLFSVFCDVFPAAALRAIVEAALRGETSHGVAASLRAEQGDSVEVLAAAAPLLGASGGIVGAIVTMTDITEVKHAQRELEVALRIRDEFLSIASHELRTPLTCLQLQLGSLRLSVERDFESMSKTRLGEKLDVATRQARRLAKLTDALLDVSRLTTGSVMLEFEEFDLTSAAREIVNDWTEEADRVGCQLRFHEDAPSVGFWDRLRFEQALGNLMSNAMKYGPGKPVDITVQRDANNVSMTVEDRGLGIGAEDQERIFQLFERAVSSQHYGGLGLGLFVTRQIVEACGGSIDVASEVGKGSTFSLSLPIRKHPPAPDTYTFQQSLAGSR